MFLSRSSSPVSEHCTGSIKTKILNTETPLSTMPFVNKDHIDELNYVNEKYGFIRIFCIDVLPNEKCITCEYCTNMELGVLVISDESN